MKTESHSKEYHQEDMTFLVDFEVKYEYQFRGDEPNEGWYEFGRSIQSIQKFSSEGEEPLTDYDKQWVEQQMRKEKV